MSDMPTNPIDAMLPGPELDAAVATQVMGYSRITEEAELRKLDGYLYTGESRPAWMQMPSGDLCERAPAYSTDIGAAWAVVDKLRTMGFGLVYSGPRYEEACEATFVGSFFHRGRGSTAPLAICLAALRAVQGREVKP